jgi:hypothetical protein
VNLTTTSNNTSSDLILDIELYWNFSVIESLGIDMASFFSDEQLKENAGLDFFANALLPGEGSATISLDGSLSFRIGIGLEYVSQTGNVNAYILGTTGIVAELSAGGNVTYEAEVGALQGTIDAEFAINGGEGGGGMSLSVGLDKNLNYYIGDPGNVSDGRTGFTNVSGISALVEEVTGTFAGQATASLSVRLALIGASLDVDILISDLNTFFRGNTSVLNVTVDPNIPSITVPSLLDILLAEPQGVIDALDDVFATAEEASLGKNGIITRYVVQTLTNNIICTLSVSLIGIQHLFTSHQCMPIIVTGFLFLLFAMVLPARWVPVLITTCLPRDVARLSLPYKRVSTVSKEQQIRLQSFLLG